MTTQALLAVALAIALSACSRSLPTTFPPASAASSAASEAPPASVGRALRSDPPLPGEPTEGWPGLEEGRAAAPDHAGHGGHGAHGGHGHAH